MCRKLEVLVLDYNIELEHYNSGDNVQVEHEHYNIASDRPRRTIKPPTKYDFEDLVSYALITNSGDPTTF